MLWLEQILGWNWFPSYWVIQACFGQVRPGSRRFRVIVSSPAAVPQPPAYKLAQMRRPRRPLAYNGSSVHSNEFHRLGSSTAAITDLIKPTHRQKFLQKRQHPSSFFTSTGEHATTDSAPRLPVRTKFSHDRMPSPLIVMCPVRLRKDLDSRW